MTAGSFCLAAIALTVAIAATGCNLKKENRPLPPLGELRTVAPGVTFAEIKLSRPNEKLRRLWVYLPAPLPAGKLPCIVIAPAGTPLFYGIRLQQGDRDEHLPYVRAGFAVVAYDIDGAFDLNADQDIKAAIEEFRASEAGVANARVAIDFALQRLPVDAHRMYTAGHSSAATLALQVAERDPRVRGVVAYAAVTDVVKHAGHFFPRLDRLVPGESRFLKRYAPLAQVDSLHCRVFLFQSMTDQKVPAAETMAFAEALKRINPRVTVSTVAAGDHYGSMIEDGIPRAIAWLQGS